MHTSNHKDTSVHDLVTSAEAALIMACNRTTVQRNLTPVRTLANGARLYWRADAEAWRRKRVRARS